MVIGFVLPKRFSRSPQEDIRAPRRVSFSAAKNLTQRMVRHGPQDEMHMVGHDHPFIEQVMLFVKMPQCPGDHVRNVRPLEVTLAHAAIEVSLELPLKLSINLFARVGFALAKPTNLFRLLPFEFEQHFLRQAKRAFRVKRAYRKSSATARLGSSVISGPREFNAATPA
jgi:hypothetical protein